MLLGDLGAEIIKVEEPIRGDYLRWVPPLIDGEGASFLAVNRNKKSLTLNLKSEKGRSIFLELIKSADVLVESFRPGTMKRFGLSYDEVRKTNANITYCSITGYGQTGPYKDLAAHDINYVAMSGVLTVGEYGDARPAIPGLPIGDVGGGALASIAILSSLIERRASGRGRYLDVSMLDGLLYWMSYHYSWYFAEKDNPEPEHLLISGSWPFYTTYPTKDRKHIAVASIEPQFWSRLCSLIGREDLIETQFSTEKRAETRAALEKVFKTRTRREWMELGMKKDLCITPVYTLRDTLSDAHTKQRKMVSEVTHPTAGTIKVIENPLRMGTAGKHLPPPILGQHTKEVLESLGYTAKDVRKLKSSGIV